MAGWLWLRELRLCIRPACCGIESFVLCSLRSCPYTRSYDSYHIAPEDWALLLQPGGSASLRGTAADGVFIGLWLNAGDGDSQLLPGGFDGAYTYFGSESVSWAANPSNWPGMAAWARQHGKLFLPSVGPGYDDSRIRPWNAGATRAREGGARYQRWWEAALAAAPAAVSITSFNECECGCEHSCAGGRGVSESIPSTTATLLVPAVSPHCWSRQAPCSSPCLACTKPQPPPALPVPQGGKALRSSPRASSHPAAAAVTAAAMRRSSGGGLRVMEAQREQMRRCT